jgi:hypothetical protein
MWAMPKAENILPSRRDLLSDFFVAAGVGVLAVPLATMAANASEPSRITRLWAEILAIDEMHFDDDAPCDAAANRQVECEMELLAIPATSRGDLLIKARLADRQDENGAPFAQLRRAAEYLIDDLERASFSI